MLLAKKVFLTKGVGVHKHKLTSFELALRDAKIAAYNLVRVSSIMPANAKTISREAGLKYLVPGQILHVVLSESSTNEPNRLIAAGIGVALPKSPDHHGYLSEHHSYGETEEKAGDYCEDLAAEMLATILGLTFDKNASYDSKKEVWKFNSEVIKTTNITQSAVGDKNGKWTTVLAACVHII